MVILASDIHFLRENKTGINRLLEDCAKDEDKLIILGGDLTQSGKEESYQKAYDFIDKLREIGMTIIVTPGNHDMGGSKNGEQLGKDEKARKRFKKLIEPIFKQPQVIHQSTYDSITRIGEKHIFVSLRSSHKGFYFGLTRATQGPRIKVSQIHWASKFLEQLENEMLEKEKENEGEDSNGKEDNHIKDNLIDDKTSISNNENNILDNDVNIDKNIQVDRKIPKKRVLGDKYVITLVMHHNIWQDSSDKHTSVDGRNKLEKELLRRFKFSVLVCGHNHRLCFANTTTPKTHFRMSRCSLPTLSSRRREYESGFLTWPLKHMGTNIGPILVEFENEN